MAESVCFTGSASQEYSERFVLEGALLFAYWMGTPHRPTRDMDLLGFGASVIGSIESVFRELSIIEVEPDGTLLQPDTVKGERIKDDEEYEGVRIHMIALLEKTRIPLQIDVAYGDRIVPGPEEIDFPTLLDFPGPHLKSYTRGSMVAEKFEAMVKLGMLNTRIKDFFDAWSASCQFEFDGSILSEAIKTTFETRGTTVPNEPPTALTPEFYNDPEKKAQWNAFLSKSKLNAEGRSLPEIAEALRSFLVPVSEAVANRHIYKEMWPRSGPWANLM